MINTLKQSMNQLFETQLLPRYQQLEAREQKIVLAASLLLPLMFIAFGLILPLQDRQIALQKELSLAQNDSVKAESMASYLIKYAADPKSNTGTENLLTAVERLARQTNVRNFITRIKPQSSPSGGTQQLMLHFKNAPYDAVLRFVHTLAKQNLGLKRMKLQTAKAPGHIHVQAIIIKN